LAGAPKCGLPENLKIKISLQSDHQLSAPGMFALFASPTFQRFLTAFNRSFMSSSRGAVNCPAAPGSFPA